MDILWVKLPAVLIVVVATAKGYPRGQRLPIRRQKMPKMKGNQLRLEDLGWKVEGSTEPKHKCPLTNECAVNKFDSMINYVGFQHWDTKVL